jgi:NAD-dependent deacetylase
MEYKFIKRKHVAVELFIEKGNNINGFNKNKLLELRALQIVMNDRIIDQLKFCKERNKQISFLVGAGLSAESGIPTFRGKDGYWVSGSKNYKAEEIGTYRMFQLASQEVWKWFLYRKSITEAAKPNQSHYMLKEIEDILTNQFALISQNVDSLHRKAGNSEDRTFLIHGDFDFVRCGDECSNELYPFPKTINLTKRDKDIITTNEWEALRCPKCEEDLRPNVLWFDEYYNDKYYKKNRVLRISKETGVLFVLGTSGATNLPRTVVENVLSKNGMVVELNIEESYFSELLKDKKNGIVIRQKTTPFLTELKDELKSWW